MRHKQSPNVNLKKLKEVLNNQDFITDVRLDPSYNLGYIIQDEFANKHYARFIENQDNTIDFYILPHGFEEREDFMHKDTLDAYLGIESRDVTAEDPLYMKGNQYVRGYLWNNLKLE